MDDKIELMVTIHEVDRSNIRPKRSSVKCYALITVNGRHMKTHVAERSHVPTWDMEFIFVVSRNRPADIYVELFTVNRFCSNKLLETFPSILYDHSQSSPDLREVVGPSGAILRITVRAVEHGAAVRALVNRTAAGLTIPIDGPDLDRAVSFGRSVLEEAETVVDVWKPLLDKINRFSEIMAEVAQIITAVAEVHPYTNVAWWVLNGAYKIYQHQRALDANVRTLLGSLSSLFDIVDDLEARKDDVGKLRKQNDLLLRIATQTVECCYFVRSYMAPGFVERMARAVLNKVPEQLRKFNEAISMLKEEYYTGIAHSTNVIVVRTLMVVDRTFKAIENLNDVVVLEQLEYDRHASMGSSKGCLPGTRTVMLDKLSSWIYAEGPETPHVAVLLGGAGMGKSSVAHSVAHRFKERGRLAASFVFDRSQKDRGASMLFPTIARHFADIDDSMKAALIAAIENDAQLRTSKDLKDQFEHLILRPFQSLSYCGPLLIAIDALDECPGDLTQLIGLLFHSTQNLPPNIRIFVTSRPERPILDVIWPDGQPQVGTASRGIQHLDLSSSEDTEFDIHRCIKNRLEVDPKRLFPNSPEQRELAAVELSKKSSPSFQFATLACNMILSSNAMATTAEIRYRNILALGKPSEKGVLLLNGLYDEAVRQCLVTDEEAGEEGIVVERFRFLMAIMVNLVEPLPLCAYQDILLDDGWHAASILGRLGSVLEGVNVDDQPIRPAHTSFRDFVTAKSSGNKSTVDSSDSSLTHARLAQASLVIMRRSGFQLTEGVSASNRRYYCLHWVTHLLAAGRSPELLQHFETFVEKDLLPWIEELANIYHLDVARDALFRSLEWYTKATSELSVSASSEITTLLQDAHRLVCEYADVLHEDSSRLPSIVQFTPSDILIKRYCASATARVLAGRAWSMNVVLEGHQGPINCVRFSPDGRYIVSGGDDGMVLTWDAASGAELKVTKSDDGTMTSVSLFQEQDVLLVASGYRTGAICVSNALSGTVIRTMQAGRSIDAVAYLPDGKQLLSVSYDSDRLDIWDSSTGSLVKPISLELKVASRIMRAAFSADGALVVTAHKDYSLRIWDSCSGAVLQTLSGHTHGVSDAVFTVDGKRVISGGLDTTIRAWSVDTGELLRTMKGHRPLTAVAVSAVHIVSADWCDAILLWNVDSYDRLHMIDPSRSTSIASLSFSPNGTQLASGSSEGIVHIWDPSVPPPPAHTDQVTYVVFSADGELVATGSTDKTIIIWETRTGKIAHRLEGHTDGVTSVAFIPDRQRLVSVGGDRLVYFWNIDTGELMQKLRGHTDRIVALAVSHDGELVATGSRDMTIRLWEMTTGYLKCVRTLTDESRVLSLAFSPDRRHLASGSYKGRTCVWDVETGGLTQAPLRLSKHRVEYVAWSPNGHYIIVSSLMGAQIVWVWSAVDRQPVQRPVNALRSIYWSEREAKEGKNVGTYRWNIFDAEVFCDESAREWTSPYVAFEVGDYGWVIHQRSGKYVCWLPPTKQRSSCPQAVAGHGGFCAIGTETGQVTIFDVSEVIDTSSSPTTS